MTPQRRTALVSVYAAVALIGIKLVAGLGAGSLGLIAEAAHSGTDLVAALLTFFAVGYAHKPADPGHQYGHGKAEHLAALAEAAVLALVSIGVGALAILRLTGRIEVEVDPAWWAFLAVGLVIAIDVTRTAASWRAARRHDSAALLSNALHFGGDLMGTLAVLAGLIAAAAGYPQGDSIAALFVAVLVLAAATRLMRVNADVLMDLAPVASVEAARTAIDAVEPPVELRRLRLRQAAGKTFVDVVIGVSPGAVVGQGHAVADRVERALEQALPGTDAVVHVEPRDDEDALRERVRAAAATVPSVREIHNLSVLELDDRIEVSMHLKLPGDLPLHDAHEVAHDVERAITLQVPEVTAVQTHVEPLAEAAPAAEVDRDPAEIERIVQEVTGRAPRETRFLHTDDGLVVFLTLGLDAGISLADAHREAGVIEERVHELLPGVRDVIVHTEPTG